MKALHKMCHLRSYSEEMPSRIFFSLHGWNRPYTPFLSKIGFPSDSYICMLTEPPTL